MMILRLISLLPLVLVAMPAYGQSAVSAINSGAFAADIGGAFTDGGGPATDAGEAIYYLTQRAIAYATPDSTLPYLDLDAREPVRVVGHTGAWTEVRTDDGALAPVPDARRRARHAPTALLGRPGGGRHGR